MTCARIRVLAVSLTILALSIGTPTFAVCQAQSPRAPTTGKSAPKGDQPPKKKDEPASKSSPDQPEKIQTIRDLLEPFLHTDCTVPDLIDHEVSDVGKELAAANLKLGRVTRRPDASRVAGRVSSLSLKPDAKVRCGDPLMSSSPTRLTAHREWFLD